MIWWWHYIVLGRSFVIKRWMLLLFFFSIFLCWLKTMETKIDSCTLNSSVFYISIYIDSNFFDSPRDLHNNEKKNRYSLFITYRNSVELPQTTDTHTQTHINHTNYVLKLLYILIYGVPIYIFSIYTLRVSQKFVFFLQQKYFSMLNVPKQCTRTMHYK